MNTSHAKQPVKGKSKTTARPSVLPASTKASAAAKVIKVVPAVKTIPPAKKERSSVRPPAAVATAATARPAVAAVPPVNRVESARVNGSEHGAAISRTDHLKARFASLSAAIAQIKSLKRALSKNFFEVAGNLQQIRNEKLYEVKGYGSFESFLEREVDLDKVMCMRLARMPNTLVREAALDVGLERACAAIAALEGEGFTPAQAPGYAVSSTALSTLPAHKR